VRAATRAAAGLLAARGIEEAALEAELLLAHALGCDRTVLLAHPDRILPPNVQQHYEELVFERGQHVPLAYLTGHAGFRNLDLLVDARVLIPRPETELVVEAVVEFATRRAPRPLRIADIGTGSGAIALALADELPQAYIYATDTSAAALAVARANAVRCGPEVAGRVTFLLGNLAEPLYEIAAANPPILFDVVASNPPYVATGEWETLPTEVRDHEPRVALWGGTDGLAFYPPLAQAAADLLRAGGILVVEMPAGAADRVAAVVGAAPGLEVCALHCDYSGIERVLIACRKEGTCNSNSSLKPANCASP